MLTLMNSEFIKMKHSLSTVLLLLLALIPIVINMSRPLMVKQNYSLFDLYFPMYNQYSLFFPLVVILLTTSIFYLEYSNGTYVDWITYGYAKWKLIVAKLSVAALLLLGMCLVNYIVMTVGLFVIIHGTYFEFFRVSVSFVLYSLLVILINLPLGAILINVFRNAIVTAVIGIVCMVINAILMAAPFGYYIPTVFAYRLGLLPLSKSYFFANPNLTLTVGMSVTVIVMAILGSAAVWQFSRRRKIEN
ncbi:MAG: ABC transporter permease [Lentilactobacillus diolivorans]|uniref:ABC transporter permease n=1 Tax=Lentilactobacillus diolivorans TaxID=179838 RepID=UPI0039E92794